MATVGPSTSSPTAGASTYQQYGLLGQPGRSAAWGVEIRGDSGVTASAVRWPPSLPAASEPARTLWVLTCTLVSNMAQGAEAEFDVSHGGGFALGGVELRPPVVLIRLADVDGVSSGTTRSPSTRPTGGAGTPSVDGQTSRRRRRGFRWRALVRGHLLDDRRGGFQPQYASGADGPAGGGSRRRERRRGWEAACPWRAAPSPATGVADHEQSSQQRPWRPGRDRGLLRRIRRRGDGGGIAASSGPRWSGAYSPGHGVKSMENRSSGEPGATASSARSAAGRAATAREAVWSIPVAWPPSPWPAARSWAMGPPTPAAAGPGLNHGMLDTPSVAVSTSRTPRPSPPADDLEQRRLQLSPAAQGRGAPRRGGPASFRCRPRCWHHFRRLIDHVRYHDLVQ